MTGGNAWLRLWPVWVVPALVVAINLVWLLGIRSAAFGGASYVAHALEQEEQAVARLGSRLEALGATAVELERLETNLEVLRNERLGSMGDRLVPFLVDVVSRAREAGLQPERIGYQAQTDEKTGLVHFLATYSLTGTYDQVRKVVFLLEDSPQFVVLERLGLQGEEDARTLDVAVQMTIGTYFAEADEELMEQYGVREVARGEP